MRTNEKVESFRQTVDPKIFEGNKCAYLKETNVVETYAFFGLVYARCLQGKNSVRMELLFSENYEHSIFSATVSKNRFNFLFSKISFDDFETRTQLWKKDRFAAIQNIFEKSNIIVENLSFRTIFFQLTKSYIPSETRWHSNNSTQIGLLSMAYYSKTSIHHVIFIHLFQRHTVESLFENQLNNTNLVP